MRISVARGRVRLYLSEHKGDARPDTLIHLYVTDIDRVSEEFAVPVDEEGLAGREGACGGADDLEGDVADGEERWSLAEYELQHVARTCTECSTVPA